MKINIFTGTYVFWKFYFMLLPIKHLKIRNGSFKIKIQGYSQRMRLQRRPKTLRIWQFEALILCSAFNCVNWLYTKWSSTEICQFRPTMTPKCKKTDKTYFVQSSLKSHPLWVINTSSNVVLNYCWVTE